MAAPRPKIEKIEKTRLELQDIKKLIEMIEKSPITEFELVDKELKIRISKNGNNSSTVHMVSAPALPVAAAPALAAPAASPAASAPQTDSRKAFTEVKSPMVGTFYRAPAPDAEAYVRIGDLVEPGKVLCIVEAMKLMNELECEVRGRVVEILVENAQPVEFGQVLFRVDTGAA